MVRSVVCTVVLALALATTQAVRGAEPDAHATRVGDSRDALPGVDRIGVVAAGLPRVAMAGTAGFGYIEPQATGDRGHQRLFGTAALAFAPLPALELGLRFDGRYDRASGDSGLTGDPRFLARLGMVAVRHFHLGVETSVWVPGRQAPSLAFDATTVDASLLGAWVPESGPVVALRAGFRLDNSGKSFEHPERLRLGDRVSLELSDYDAALVGLGVSYPLARTEILGELTWDILVGQGAPGALQSPLRAALGARAPLTDAVSLSFLVEGSPSQRPPSGPFDPLVPIGPRLSAMVGLRARLPLAGSSGTGPAERESPVGNAAVAGKPEAPTATVSSKVSVGIRVTNDAGAPVTTAVVELRGRDWTQKRQGCPEGLCRFDDVPPGEAQVTVSAEGYESGEQDARFEPGARIELRVALRTQQPLGQIRGLVRSFGGRSLSALVTVEPLGKQIQADARGYFTLDVPPGQYNLVIRAPGFKDQRRTVTVENNGVTVLNAELFEAGRRQ